MTNDNHLTVKAKYLQSIAAHMYVAVANGGEGRHREIEAVQPPQFRFQGVKVAHVGDHEEYSTLKQRGQSIERART